jgi:chemotaxis protein MotB
MRANSLFALFVIVFLSSCVSQKKYNDMYALWVYADDQYQILKYQKSKNNCKPFEEEIIRLKKDSSYLDSMFRAYMDASEKDRNKLKQELQTQSSRLILSAAKISELESLLFRKDSIMRATHERLTAALIGFKEKGVNVHVEGGKVYISLDERLLFKSGQIDVNPAGVEALMEISNALNADTSTNLTVEGHTDDIPFKSKTKPYKDNWDISVLRATSVVRLMQQQGNIDPKRFIASGRAEYLPIDSAKTPEARKKNRRIEIIVTPDLDEIARLLSN